MGRQSKSLYIMLLIVIIGLSVFAEYKEGIDTTDNCGYGIDSSFQILIIGDSSISIRAEDVIIYAFDSVNGFSNSSGYFPYSFDEIRKAPDTIKKFSIYDLPIYNTTFIAMKIDSSYTKVQLLERISEDRFIYKYGRNTVPNNLLLTYENYNRDSLYPPDNFHIYNFWNGGGVMHFSWNPPIENNNTLLGYKVFNINKDLVNILDSINLDNLEPSEIIDTTWARWGSWGYFNIVAVYEEGESKPLQGWMYVFNNLTFIYNNNDLKTPANDFKVYYNNYDNIMISLPNDYNNQKASFNIYNTKGRLINHVSNFEKNPVILNISELGMASGNYIIQFITGNKIFTDKFYYQK